MPKKPLKSGTSINIEDEILERLRPILRKTIGKNFENGVIFDQIEKNSCATGDLLSRILMEVSISDQKMSPESIDHAREVYLKDLKEQGLPVPEESSTVHKNRQRTIKTVRGPVQLSRSYHYYPAAKGGFFPSR